MAILESPRQEGSGPAARRAVSLWLLSREIATCALRCKDPIAAQLTGLLLPGLQTDLLAKSGLSIECNGIVSRRGHLYTGNVGLGHTYK